MTDQRIEDILDLPLGFVLSDCEGQRWVFIGKRKTTTGYSHQFVREGNLHFTYSCAFLETLKKKFPAVCDK